MGSPLLKVVPADVGDREARSGIKLRYPARENAQTLHSTILITALIEHLQAHADAKKWASCLQRRLRLQWLLWLNVQVVQECQTGSTVSWLVLQRQVTDNAMSGAQAYHNVVLECLLVPQGL